MNYLSLSQVVNVLLLYSLSHISWQSEVIDIRCGHSNRRMVFSGEPEDEVPPEVFALILEYAEMDEDTFWQLFHTVYT